MNHGSTFMKLNHSLQNPQTAASIVEPIAAQFSGVEHDCVVAAANRATALMERTELAAQVAQDITAAEILAAMGLDASTVAAALARTAADHYSFDRTADSKAPIAATEWLTATYGEETTRLIQNAQKARQIEAMSAEAGNNDSGAPAGRLERLRKMLLAMAEDIRVVFILLAERTALM